MPGDRDPGAAISSPMTCCCSAIRRYVTTEEGYPGLIVHGPLLATLLLDLFRRNASRPVKSFTFRALSPVFDTTPFSVCGTPRDDGADLWVRRADGALCMQATVQT